MQKTILGLVKVIVVMAMGGEAFVKMSCLESTSLLLINKIQAMPIWLRLPILMLTVLFNVSGVLLTGHLFCAQSFSQQTKMVGMWQRSPIKVFREFIKFYEKLALFIYFSIP